MVGAIWAQALPHASFDTASRSRPYSWLMLIFLYTVPGLLLLAGLLDGLVSQDESCPECRCSVRSAGKPDPPSGLGQADEHVLLQTTELSISVSKRATSKRQQNQVPTSVFNKLKTPVSAEIEPLPMEAKADVLNRPNLSITDEIKPLITQVQTGVSKRANVSITGKIKPLHVQIQTGVPNRANVSMTTGIKPLPVQVQSGVTNKPNVSIDAEIKPLPVQVEIGVLNRANVSITANIKPLPVEVQRGVLNRANVPTNGKMMTLPVQVQTGVLNRANVSIIAEIKSSPARARAGVPKKPNMSITAKIKPLPVQVQRGALNRANVSSSGKIKPVPVQVQRGVPNKANMSMTGTIKPLAVQVQIGIPDKPNNSVAEIKPVPAQVQTVSLNRPNMSIFAKTAQVQTGVPNKPNVSITAKMKPSPAQVQTGAPHRPNVSGITPLSANVLANVPFKTKVSITGDMTLVQKLVWAAHIVAAGIIMAVCCTALLQRRELVQRTELKRELKSSASSEVDDIPKLILNPGEVKLNEKYAPAVPRLSYCGASFVLPMKQLAHCSKVTMSFDIPLWPSVWPYRASICRPEVRSRWELIELTVDIISAAGLPPLLLARHCVNEEVLPEEQGVLKVEIHEGIGKPVATIHEVNRDCWTLHQSGRPVMDIQADPSGMIVVTKEGNEIGIAHSLDMVDDSRNADYVQLDTLPDVESSDSSLILLSVMAMLTFAS